MRANWYEAAVGGHSKSIARLIAEGADIDSLDQYGQTALMLAAAGGHDDVVRILLANGADKNVSAKYALSALMLAVINRHTDFARQLVDAREDVSIRGSGAPGFAGKTARDLAIDADLRELASYIAISERRSDIASILI